jgi:hypothetical protein
VNFFLQPTTHPRSLRAVPEIFPVPNDLSRGSLFGRERDALLSDRIRALQREAPAERPKLSGARPQDRKDNNMITVALAIAWFAVVGLVLIARGDYRARQLVR